MEKIDAYQAAALYDTGVPLFIGSDEEGGTVTRASRNPNLFPAVLPSPRALYQAGGMTGLLTDTLQYTDYGKYMSSIFDPEHKARMRAEKFPRDLEAARQLGARLAAA